MEFIENIMAQIVSRRRHFCHVSYYGSNAPYVLICYSAADSGSLQAEQNTEYTEEFLEGKSKIVIRKKKF